MTKLKATVLVRVPGTFEDTEDPAADAVMFLRSLITVGLESASINGKWSVRSEPDSGVIEIDFGE